MKSKSKIGFTGVVFFYMCHIGIAQIPDSTNKGSNRMETYTDLMRGKVIRQSGLITTSKIENKFYWEIEQNLLGNDLLIVSRISKSAADLRVGMNGYAGDQINSMVIRWEKAPNNKIFLRKISSSEYSKDSTMPLYAAVVDNNIQPIVASFNIKAINPETQGLVIDVTEYINSDNDILFFDPNIKTTLKLGAIQADKSYIVDINTYPQNVEIKTLKTYARIPQQNLFGGSIGGGNATVEINTSIVLLPEKPMQPRYADKRVGYFFTSYTDFDKDPQGVKKIELIKRWRLEPKQEDIEKYKRGELVEPQKSIVFYIDPATPTKWVPYLIQGVNDWQVAFEKAGLKNAIVAKVAPTKEQDSTWSLEDARFSAIVYKPSSISNASGPSIIDPRSGEILESHVNWYHNVMKLLHHWYFIQTAAVDVSARSMQFSDSLMGQLIRFISSHEIGHTLGLRHNFGASSTVPVDSLRSKKWVGENGICPSIMDYARFNYVAQPEDSISEIGLFPRIGPYDKWAIEWGYRLFPGINDSEKEVSILNKLTIKKNQESYFWFGSETEPDDPRSQNEDLGDNAMKAGEYGIKNLKRIIVNLPVWTKLENEDYENLTEMYSEVVDQYTRYIGHVMKNIGGIYETPKTVEQAGDVYEFVTKEKQIEAMEFLNKNVFITPTWLINKNINGKIGIDPLRVIGSKQERVLSDLLNTGRLNKLISAEAQVGNRAFSISELFNYLQKEIWSELYSKKVIDVYRRNLQKTFLDKIIGLVNPSSGNSPSFLPGLPSGAVMISVGGSANNDIISIAKAELKELKKTISNSIPLINDKLTKFHLQDCLERIELVLNQKK